MYGQPEVDTNNGFEPSLFVLCVILEYRVHRLVYTDVPLNLVVRTMDTAVPMMEDLKSNRDGRRSTSIRWIFSAVPSPSSVRPSMFDEKKKNEGRDKGRL